MSALVSSLREKIASGPPVPASSASATSACRSRSNSPKAASTTTGIDLDARKIERDQRRAILHSGRADGDVAHAARRRASSTRPPTSRSSGSSTRSTSACRRRCARRRTRTCRTSCLRSKRLPKHLHPGMLVVLESTTYPGTTDEVVQPLLEATGLKAGKDFFLAFSPERVDPGNPTFQTQQHAEGRRRPHARMHRAGGRALRHGDRDDRARSARRAWPRWSSCSRTRSAPSTSAWSTRWR